LHFLCIFCQNDSAFRSISSLWASYQFPIGLAGRIFRLDFNLNQYFTLDVGLDDLLSAADYIFDNFFTDMMSQSRINTARRQVQDAIAQVEGILDALAGL
jgi:hypothetical protein